MSVQGKQGNMMDMSRMAITALLMTVLGAACASRDKGGALSRSDPVSRDVGAQVFFEATRQSGNAGHLRVEAIREIAREEEYRGWLVMILSNPLVLDRFEVQATSSAGRKEMFRKFRDGFLIELIRAIPNDAPPDVQYALTNQLDNDGRGRIEEKVMIDGRMVYRLGVSDPVKFAARTKLVEILGSDDEFDVVRWRWRILEMEP